jgi:transcriptional regulator with XRE-family HTH domain
MAQTRFKNADDIESEYRIFNEILVMLWRLNGEAEIKELAHASGVGVSTLYAWRSGYTISPQIRTLTRVARSLGYEIVLKRTRRAPLRQVR